MFYLQLREGDYLSNLAIVQQTTSDVITSKRGNIYDSTGTSLALNEPVDTITLNPAKFEKDTDEETQSLKKLVATGLSDIFDLDYKETLAKINSQSSVVTIAQKVEEDKVIELKNWMKENKIKNGINIDPDAKRVSIASSAQEGISALSVAANRDFFIPSGRSLDIIVAASARVIVLLGSAIIFSPSALPLNIPL